MKWTRKDIPNQKGKTVLITGANSGIGKEAALQLAAKGANVILAVRSIKKGKIAKNDILRQYPEAHVSVMTLDLASMQSVKRFASAFKKQHSQLNILINNAGVMVPPYSKTEDGFELQFGVNHLGHFALTIQLLPLIKKTKAARIVTVSSIAHTSGNIDFTDLHWDKRAYKNWQAYGDSKIANLHFTYELARKLKDEDVLVVAAHPGLTNTNLQKHMGKMSMLTAILGQKTAMGALPTLRAATDPYVKSGEYYGPSGFKEARGYPVKVQSNKRSHSKDIAAKLWKVSESLTKVRITRTS